MATHMAAIAAATTSAPYTGQAPTPTDWLTYNEFLKRFKMRWISSNNGMEVITRITKMKQMGSVADYNSVFVTTAYDTGLNDAALVPYYRMGLKPTVLRQILSSETFKGMTISEWVDKATMVDDIYQISMGNQRGGTTSSKLKKRRDNNMDINTVKMTKGKGKGIPREKREHLQSEGKCFHCEKKYEPGHMCQKKKEAQRKWNERD
jgi:hypothetical protein